LALNSPYTSTAESKDIILNHMSVLDTLNIPNNEIDKYGLPLYMYLYWNPELHKDSLLDLCYSPKYQQL
jgi:hypothetical protein